MEETHLFLYCSSDDNDELLVRECQNDIMFDINPSEDSPTVLLNKENVKLLAAKLNAWLAK